MASTQIRENFTTIIPGLRFRPSDDELIGYYLLRKIFGCLPLPCHIIVKDCDLYGSQEPWEIWEFYKRNFDDNEDLYFFTALKKKSSLSNRISRKIGSGSWMGEDSATEIRTDDKVIGSKKRYRYEKKGSEHDGGWIMHEYSLLSHDKYVLCRIRKNDRPTKKRGQAKRTNLNAKNYQGTVESEATKLVIDEQVIWFYND